MDWVKDGAHWPHREASRFVSVGGTRWHLQQMGHDDDGGDRPHAVLLHGSGATTHSYAGLLPEMARDFRVTALDLPGHGFTTMLGSGRPALPRVAEGVAALLAKEGIEPGLIVGHSAGAAVSVQMAATALIQPKALVSINGSFFPFPGMAQVVFPAAAKLFFYNPFVPRLVAASAKNPKRIMKLIQSTGSQLSEAQMALYQTAFQSSKHVEGTLEMMANWNLEAMEGHLRALECRVLQIIGGADGTVKPSQSVKTATFLKRGKRIDFETCGHLVHEEKPVEVAAAICEFAADAGVFNTAKTLRK